jgi:phosphate transport system permease protein
VSSTTIADRPPEPAPARAGIKGAVQGDRVYRLVTMGFALVVPLLLLLIAIEVFAAGWPAFRQFGLGFLTESRWDAVNGQFGAAPMIFGTVISSAIALIVATPLAIGVAVFLSELAPPWMRQPVAFLVDLLAAIPSVVYGLWAIFVLVPFVRDTISPFLAQTLHLGGTPLFAGPSYGYSMLAAGLVLSIMVLPYISAVTREVLMAVPRSQREAALALGATRWEMIRDAVLPYARSGIIGGIMLGLGRALGETMAVTMVIGKRALGETMAVTMVIGNAPEINASLLKPGYTLASVIANEFAEATGDLHVSTLMAVGGVLFLITIVVNALARWLVWRVDGGRT